MAQTESSPSHQIDPDSLAALPRTSGAYIFKDEGIMLRTARIEQV